MKSVRRLWLVVKRTGGLKAFIGYLILVCTASVVLGMVEPQIHTFFDSLWYCFMASSTIGFGDIYAVTTIGRIITVVVAVYGIFATAMLTSIVVGYYMEYLRFKEKETVSLFLEQLEELPNLSQDSLRELAEQVKKFNSVT